MKMWFVIMIDIITTYLFFISSSLMVVAFLVVIGVL